MSKNVVVAALLVLSTWVLASCVSAPSRPAAAIAEADDHAVSQCKFVGLVTGNSLLGGAVQRRARENAKTHALEDAAKLGATHIVWTEVASSISNGANAQGRAYRCGQESPQS